MHAESLIDLLRTRFAAAISTVSGDPPAAIDAQVRPSGDAKFGDYQCNAAMSLGKRVGQPPRAVAQRIVDAADLAGIAERLEIAGPGFINVHLADRFLERRLAEIPPPPPAAADSALFPDRLGIPPTRSPMRVVVDYSSPNIAKQMHVGNLRSTAIGDVFVRVLTFQGHEVIRQNHVGDWGTQFGMLIAHYGSADRIPSGEDEAEVLAAIERDYRAAHEKFKSDPSFAEKARLAVGQLQSGEPRSREIWERLCTQSRRAFLRAYERLGVLLTDDDVRGESFYNDRLAQVVEDIRTALSAPGGRVVFREDQGAACVYFYDEKGAPLYRTQDGGELPMIIRKSDGAYLYATTDLAAVRFRVDDLGGKRLIYVTDPRQAPHFERFFAVARAMGWAPPEVSLEHATFGMVLKDGRPIKTRDGGTVKLVDLLDEGERAAAAVLRERSAARAEGVDDALPGAEREDVARRIGIASLKYNDLAHDRTKDYEFDWEKLLSMKGNTASYLLYGYARAQSTLRKAQTELGDLPIDEAPVQISEPLERVLALHLLRFHETVDAVAASLMPHILCNYLYELAAAFMRFYEGCPVIKAESDALRASRLRLCALTARTTRLGLELLGMESLERM